MTGKSKLSREKNLLTPQRLAVILEHKKKTIGAYCIEKKVLPANMIWNKREIFEFLNYTPHEMNKKRVETLLYKWWKNNKKNEELRDYVLAKCPNLANQPEIKKPKKFSPRKVPPQPSRRSGRLAFKIPKSTAPAAPGTNLDSTDESDEPTRDYDVDDDDTDTDIDSADKDILEESETESQGAERAEKVEGKDDAMEIEAVTQPENRGQESEEIKARRDLKSERKRKYDTKKPAALVDKPILPIASSPAKFESERLCGQQPSVENLDNGKMQRSNVCKNAPKQRKKLKQSPQPAPVVETKDDSPQPPAKGVTETTVECRSVINFQGQQKPQKVASNGAARDKVQVKRIGTTGRGGNKSVPKKDDKKINVKTITDLRPLKKVQLPNNQIVYVPTAQTMQQTSQPISITIPEGQQIPVLKNLTVQQAAAADMMRGVNIGGVIQLQPATEINDDFLQSIPVYNIPGIGIVEVIFVKTDATKHALQLAATAPTNNIESTTDPNFGSKTQKSKSRQNTSPAPQVTAATTVNCQSVIKSVKKVTSKVASPTSPDKVESERLCGQQPSVENLDDGKIQRSDVCKNALKQRKKLVSSPQPAPVVERKDDSPRTA